MILLTGTLCLAKAVSLFIFLQRFVMSLTLDFKMIIDHGQYPSDTYMYCHCQFSLEVRVSELKLFSASDAIIL